MPERQTVTPRTDSDTSFDYPVWPMWLCLYLQTALVQGDDFSSGTSSRSTSLIHGGVRYLQKAIIKLDYKQEPYFAICMNIHGSRSILSSRRVPLTPLSFVPPGGWNEWWCEPSGGQHNDARMNLTIALTAARYGAAIANYTEVVHLLKRADPQTGKEEGLRSARQGRQEFDVRAKCVINATGPFTDALRKMDDQKNPDICQPSAGCTSSSRAITGRHLVASARKLEVIPTLQTSLIFTSNVQVIQLVPCSGVCCRSCNTALARDAQV
ncbi:uncharacterized protein V6R79_011670 [Siganus canaliculatus]